MTTELKPVCGCTGMKDVATLVDNNINKIEAHTPECIIGVLAGTLLAVDNKLALIRSADPIYKDLTLEDFVRRMREGDLVPQISRERAVELVAQAAETVMTTETGLPIVVVGRADVGDIFRAVSGAIRQRIMDQQAASSAPAITPVLGRIDEPN